MTSVTSQVSHVKFFFGWGDGDKVVGLVGGGSVINGAYPLTNAVADQRRKLE